MRFLVDAQLPLALARWLAERGYTAERRARTGGGPSIVWIRVGNTSRRELLTWFRFRLPVIVEALDRGETLIEIV